LTTYSTAISTPAAAVVTSLASAIASAQTLSVAMAPGSGGALTGAGAFFAGCTLGNLATSTTGWRMNAREMGELLAVAQSDLSSANQKFVMISSMLASIGTLD
jgi:hypothetical protein